LTSPCHVCGSTVLRIAPGSERFQRVTSDCKPWPSGGTLATCGTCGTVQAVITPAWIGQADRIYRSYQVYHQGGGAEQAVFDPTGAGATRSSRLVARLAEHAALPPAGRILDVGCGNGMFLRAFAAQYSSWSLWGAEYDDKHRTDLVAIPGFQALHTGPLTELSEKFEFISIVHTLEHIVNPTVFLAQIRGLLAPGGILFIQVPHYRDNPFELMTADHATHFDAASLAALMARTEFAARLIRTDWIGNELSAVATSSPCSPFPEPLECESASTDLSLPAGLQWLSMLLERAGAGQSAHPVFGLFGSSIAATWTAANLPRLPDFFVDEDPARIGRAHMGRPILSPAQVPAQAAVFVALQPASAEAVRLRLSTTSPGHWLA
jgi:SAM-dependent methyltransferase